MLYPLFIETISFELIRIQDSSEKLNTFQYRIEYLLSRHQIGNLLKKLKCCTNWQSILLINIIQQLKCKAISSLTLSTKPKQRQFRIIELNCSPLCLYFQISFQFVEGGVRGASLANISLPFSPSFATFFGVPKYRLPCE